MSLASYFLVSQAICLSFFTGACTRKVEVPVIHAPPTYPLSRPVVGYGVVTMSYTMLVTEPGGGIIIQGYLRRGSIVTIVERRILLNDEKPETWVRIEPDGWVKESTLNVYDTESQAQTAAEVLAHE